ncbi:MAG: hypothetical protein N2D54_02240, partial [Chloroflexota bacterium]
MSPIKKSFFALILISIVIMGCGSRGLSPEELKATAQSIAETMSVETIAALPSNTPTLTPTITPTQTPTSTPTITPTPTPSLTPTLAASATRDPNGMKYWLLRENTGGSVGCGDTLAFINTGIPPSGDAIKDIRTVFTAQFAPKGEYFFGLYNPLHGSNATIEDIFVDGNGYVMIASGFIDRGPKGCRWDQIRVIVKQAKQTIPDVGAIEIK